MLNLDLLRREPDRVRVAARRRGIGTEFVDRILELDRRRRAAITAVEALKAEKNALTAQIGRAADKRAAAAELRPQLAVLDERIAASGERLPVLERQIDAELAEIPNVLDGSVPDGSDEHAQADLVVLAASALFNPHILLRSGINHPLLGKRLHDPGQHLNQ